MHHTIIAVDVERFSQRDPAHQRKIHEGLQPLVREAVEHCGLAWEKCYHEDRGDGVLVLAPPDAHNERLAECLPHELAGRLREYNYGAARGARIRLRVVMHAGEVSHDRQGVAGPAVILAFRLLDAEELRKALARSHGVLALITSEDFFHNVVESHPGANPGIYQKVRVRIKETDTTAWICLPDNHIQKADAGTDPGKPEPPQPRRGPPRGLGLTAISALLAGILGGTAADAPPDFHCAEPVQLNVAVSVEKATVVRKLARSFEDQPWRRDGRLGCKQANDQVTVASSDKVIAALGRGWSGAADLPDVGAEPGVWLPDSRREVEAVQRKLERDRRTDIALGIRGSIGTSPLVLATPKLRGGAQSAPDQHSNWQELLETAKRSPQAGQNGTGFQRPTPVSSGAGLVTTIALYSAALGPTLDAGTLTSAEARGRLYDIERVIGTSDDDSTTLLCSLRQRKDDLPAGVAVLVSEKAAGDYNEGGALGTGCPPGERPLVPLELSYPTQGTAYLDHPFVMVNWNNRPVNEHRQRIVQDFFDFLVGQEAQDEFRRAWFRNPNGDIAPPFAGALQDRPAELPAGTVDVNALLEAFQDARKPVRALFLVDVSRSMSAPFRDAGGNRQRATADAIGRSLRSIGDADQVALWEFAKQLNGQQDFRVSASMGNPTAVRNALNELRSSGRTDRLNDTLKAAIDSFQSDGSVRGTRDAIVILADGTAKESNAEDLNDHLRSGPRSAPVFMIAFGIGACATAQWQEINRLTGGFCQEIGSRSELDGALESVATRLWGGHG
jgi:Mg-chelatase subunit ChlD